MPSTYTGKTMDRRYRGEHADVTYSLKRCIHAEECVNRLAQVFDRDKRPWIDPDGAPADDLTRVVLMCPSGALHIERKDGGLGETLPHANAVILWRDGPLQLHGDLEIIAAGVNIEDETRATLCRCGASQHKPFCDNAHVAAGFTALEPVPQSVEPLEVMGGRLRVTVGPNGPLHLKGRFEVVSESGETVFRGEETWLCRCGGSQNKPFCDGTHKRNGFQAE